MATTTKKPTTTIRKKAPVKRTAIKAVKAPTAAVSTAPVTAPVEEVPTLRKKELIDRVVLRSGIKKKDAKPTIEAMLAVLGEALSGGEELNLHPMGKMKVTRVIEKENATVMVTKVRRQKLRADATVVKIAPKP